MKTIEPYKSSLSANNAYWMAKIARLVYYNRPDDTPDEEKIIADLKAEDEKFISVTGDSKNSAQAILVEHEDYFCLAFRGTNELNDWFDNFNAFLEKKLFGKFHRGFFYSVEDNWGPLFSKYQELRQKKKRPLFLTGHSLGGAMATIAAAKLIYKGLPFISVYTFGQPRAVEIATARLFNIEAKSRFFRFHNNNDLVTRFPTRLMGYSHVGTYIYISEQIELHLEPGFWFRFLDSIDGAANDLFRLGIDGVNDHSMDKYLSAVKNWDLI
ncbi:MAG: lipase family protein [Cyanobacteria bacterium P01_H01_bin.35]